MSLFKRLLNPNYKADNTAKKGSHGKYYPKEALPLDEQFTFNFRKNGGKFLYCISRQEVLDAFDEILLENDWYEKDVFCIDSTLIEQFDGFNLKYTKRTDSDFFLSGCESLIANDGSLLISSNQVKEKKLFELPTNIIIFATTSQFVENISEGLRIIKNKSAGAIPTNITAIKDFETEKEKDFLSYGSSTKNLYLLLLEDL